MGRYVIYVDQVELNRTDITEDQKHSVLVYDKQLGTTKSYVKVTGGRFAVLSGMFDTGRDRIRIWVEADNVVAYRRGNGNDHPSL